MERLEGKIYCLSVNCLDKVWSLNPRPVKSYPALQTVRHRFNNYQAAVLPWRYDAEMGIANSLHTST